MIKKQVPGSFVSVDVSRRTRKSQFFHPISTVIDWTVFEKERYQVCKRSLQDAAGRPAYTPIVLFKRMLLQTWHHLFLWGWIAVSIVIGGTQTGRASSALK